MISAKTNLIGLISSRGVERASDSLSVSVQRLSSGLRINHARDDSAGLGISQELQRQVRSTEMAKRNALSAISMVQTAESSLSNVSDLLQRMRQLSVQGAQDGLSMDQKRQLSGEITQLRDEINAIATRTSFNGMKVLTGDFTEAQSGQFNLNTNLNPSARASLIGSTIREGDSSATVAGKSSVQFSYVSVDDAGSGTYTLTNNGAQLTLQKTDANGVVTSQSLTLTTSTPKSLSEVSLSQNVGGSTTLNFFQLGVTLDVKNTAVGSDHTAAEIATKIVGIGTTVNEQIKNAGWTKVEGADWASGSGTLKAVVTSSGGEIRTTLTAAQMTTLGIAAVSGYATLGSSALNAGRYEMAFTGSAAALNSVLATLEVDNKTGLGDISIDIVPDDISVFTNSSTGATSYYQVVRSDDINWDTARSAALSSVISELGLPTDYDNGYLANITSAEESAFLAEKLNNNGWIGASDWYYLINEAIGNRNSWLTSGQLVGEGNAFRQNTLTYADQAAAEGKWYWIDGPEAGLQFQNGNVSGGAVNLVSGGIGQVQTAYADWARADPTVAIRSGVNQGIGEPNNADATVYTYPGNVNASGEHFAYAIGGATWNDFSIGNNNVDYYVIEYGGYKGVYGSTSKSILLGTPGSLKVGTALSISRLDTAGARDGVFKLSTNASNQNVTLTHYDVDGTTLLGDQTIYLGDKGSISSGQTRQLSFDSLGVSVTLSNSSDESITIWGVQAGLTAEHRLASSRMVSAVSERGPVFQLGEGTRADLAAGVFRDIRIGENSDTSEGALFNQLDASISDLGVSVAMSGVEFQGLQGDLDRVLEAVTRRRTDFGNLQRRLESSSQNLFDQNAGLTNALGVIQDADFGFESARLARMQIGYNAAGAMLAQANQLPSVVLELLL
ncbi:hypothetical protein GH816_06275 [Betaproteobacteria bacterium LSUCC0115]|nr:hypothetical protein [Burkholderiales bacterium LSUCC0115]